MKLSTHQQNPVGSWVEKRAGVLVSLFVHLAILSFLVTGATPPVHNMPTPDRLNFILQPVVNVPSPVVDTRPEPALSAAAATAPQVSHEENQSLSVTETQPPPLEMAAHTSSIEQQLRIERRKLQAEFKRLDDQKKTISSQLNARLALAQVKKGKYRTKGPAKGPVRAIDFKGYPESVVQDVMKRYDIRVEQKFVDANMQPSFLSYAETNEGVYLNREGSGYYEVFVLGRPALAKMSKLEHEELIKMGHNLNQTTVERAVFGIVKRDEAYDLGLIEFEARPID